MAENNKKQPEEPGVQLFTLAYDPVTTTITYQTGLPLSKVVELVQTIMLGQQRQIAKAEVMAELAAKEKTTKRGKK